MATQKVREPIVKAMLGVFLSNTDEHHVRGIHPGQPIARVLRIMGEPSRVDADEEVGDRVLTSHYWEREVTVAAVVFTETVNVITEVRPARGLTAVGIKLSGTEVVSREARETFKRLKTELLNHFGKGSNKSTFRAPGLEHEEGHCGGWVAVFFYKPATIVMNASVED